MGMANSFHVFTTMALLTSLILNQKAGALLYLNHFCPANNTFTPNSIYGSNLQQLLSSLSSNAQSQGGFYNTSVGQNTSEAAYGLFLCRGDLSGLDCQECVSTAIQDLVQQFCPIEKDAIVFYEECMLRYSNQPFISHTSTEPGVSQPSTGKISDPVRFNQLLTTTMNNLVNEVVNVSDDGKRFATTQVNFTGSQTIYILEQCTLDISSSDCSVCIKKTIATLAVCCSGSLGARVEVPSCRIEYQMYQFYLASTTAPTTPFPAILNPPGPPVSSQKGKQKILTARITGTVVAAAVLLLLVVMGFYFIRRSGGNVVTYQIAANDDSNLAKLVDSLKFDLATIQAATNKFSEDNKLGTGGFGEVYKGILPNGQEIAVKRLLRSSAQGVEEFKNEIILVAKLQHRNLVRLLGFCFEREEKLLVYEFVPNKSLDHFLEDPDKQRILDWPTRYKIIKGIVRGILYLHEDCHIKIIHRDLKPSNILLDEDMNPKISDFGISKIFEDDQTQANTSTVVGTYGYMAPEYAIYGQFSVKSDAYSFGVLVLEILSGRKSTTYLSQTSNAEDLRSYAWKHWKDGKPLMLLDPTLRDSCSSAEAIRCINIALLCVQENPAKRPEMASIVLMLDSFSVTLPPTEEPAFIFHGTPRPPKKLTKVPSSINEASITELEPR